MTNPFTVGALIALTVMIVDFLKPYIPAKVPTIPVGWVVAIGLVFLAAGASAFADQQIAGHLIGDLDWQSKVFAGVAIGSGGSLIVKGYKAFDSSDTAAVVKGTAYTDQPQ